MAMSRLIHLVYYGIISTGCRNATQVKIAGELNNKSVTCVFNINTDYSISVESGCKIYKATGITVIHELNSKSFSITPVIVDESISAGKYYVDVDYNVNSDRYGLSFPKVIAKNDAMIPANNFAEAILMSFPVSELNSIKFNNIEVKTMDYDILVKVVYKLSFDTNKNKVVVDAPSICVNDKCTVPEYPEPKISVPPGITVSVPEYLILKFVEVS